MKKQSRLCVFLLLVSLSIVFGAQAEGNPFEGAYWNTGIMTGSATPTPFPENEALPAATSVPESRNSELLPTASGQDAIETPSAATYRYLTCTPGSGVPLYPTSTSSKEDTRLSRGTLVLVHEYANGRARITFGGWKGWINASNLTTTDPGTGEKVGYRYAYDASGSVSLYRYGFEYPIAAVPSGAKVAITDMKKDGYTYVMHGAVSGWVRNSSLVQKLPEGVEGQEGSSYYYRSLEGDAPGQAVQLYADSSCGEWSKCGTLPEGTVVKVLNTQLNILISYGGREYYVKPRSIFQELGGNSSDIDAGITIPVQESGLDSQDTNSRDETAIEATRSSGMRSTNRVPEDPPRASVELVYLGLVESLIRDADGERTVPTVELEFETDAPAGKRVAYIYAPNTGKCSLWKKASKNSDLIKKCKAGTVVLVLDYGSKFCKIRYDGKEGYVLTACLRFPGDDIVYIGTGRISYKGKTTGSTTVNVRGEGSSDAHKIAEWRTGTEVTVFSLKDGWYEVEFNGIHGWVQEKFLTMND